MASLQHVKEPQAEIGASEKNLADSSCSMSEVTLMTFDVKKCHKTQQQQPPKDPLPPILFNPTIATSTISSPLRETLIFYL